MRAIFKVIFKFITIIIYRPKIIGAENIPKDSGAILCANHIHFWDSVVIITMLKRKVNVLAKEELFSNKFNRWFANVIGVYPVKRGSADLGAIRTSLKLMKNNELLLIFPEGTRNGLAKGSKVKKGAVMIAATTEAPIVPIGVQGSFKLFTKVTLNIGNPIDYSKYKEETKDKEKMAELAKELMDEIVVLRDSKTGRIDSK